MAVLCTLPAQNFLPVCKPQFIKSRFSLLVVFQILCFTRLRFLQLQKRFLQKVQKFLDFGGFAPSPARQTRAVTGVARTPSATLCAFQVSKYFFQVLVPGELEAQLRLILKSIPSVIHCRFHFDFPKIGICICYVRLPYGFLRLVHALYITLSTIVLELLVFAFLAPK